METALIFDLYNHKGESGMYLMVRFHFTSGSCQILSSSQYFLNVSNKNSQRGRGHCIRNSPSAEALSSLEVSVAARPRGMEGGTWETISVFTFPTSHSHDPNHTFMRRLLLCPFRSINQVRHKTPRRIYPGKFFLEELIIYLMCFII